MIIGISGKINTGKDLVGLIIQYLTDIYAVNNKLSFNEWLQEEEGISKEDGYTPSPFEIKKYADKLKEVMTLIAGIDIDKWENERGYRDQPMGEEWNRTEYHIYEGVNLLVKHSLYDNAIIDLEYYENLCERLVHLVEVPLIMTPRNFAQLLGTDAGRHIIHPNIWINALFSDYKEKCSVCGGIGYHKLSCRNSPIMVSPDWIVTDVRFPDEAEAIKSRKGFNIRLERFCYDSLEDYLVCYPDKKVFKKAVKIVAREDDWEKDWEKDLLEIPESKNYIPLSEQHESETALDNYDKFDYTIENNGSIEELVEKVKEILIKEGIICKKN